MDSITGITGSSTVNTSTPAQGNKDTVAGTTDLGENQFLALLVTELKNQDPLQPLQNSEFVAQLATFSSLEKLTSIESILKARLGSSTDTTTATGV